MADLVIRGMEMPTVCIDNGWYGNCPMDRSWCAQRFAPKDSTNGSAHKDQWNKLPSWCPLVPLPEGHGRLIDGHKLYRALFATECGNIAADRDSEGWPKVLTYEAVKKAIQDATIIVPAEGGTDDGT